MSKNYIIRNIYLDKITPFIDKEIVKVLVGQRRVGKSYMFYQLMDYIEQKNPYSNIIYINFGKSKFSGIDNWTKLLDYITKKSLGQKNYVFIDEIHKIKDFGECLKALLSFENYDIYCTGSNSKAIKKELQYHIAKNFHTIKISGLSYDEFCLFHDLEESQDSFFQYLNYGGLPYLKHLELSEEQVLEYLNGVYNTILYQDIVKPHQLRNTDLLESVIKYLADNTSNIISASKIKKQLKIQGQQISTNAILNYLEYLQDTNLINKVERYDLLENRFYESGEKYYFEDLGIRRAILKQRVDFNKTIENLIYQHLIYLGYSVKVGVQKKREINFIVQKNDEVIYIQATSLLKDLDKTNELKDLLKIKGTHRKMIICLEENYTNSYNDVEIVSARDFIKGTI